MSIRFRNQDLLREAFTISRGWGGCKSDVRDNERLEFFGDAVLYVLVAEHLFRRFPDRDEGDLTMIRSALVTTTTLARVAEGLGMSSCICREEEKRQQYVSTAQRRILADTFEAFVGALTIDQGYDACRSFLAHVLFPRVEGLLNKDLHCPKNALQERSARREGVNPTYRVADVTQQEDDRQQFYAEVRVSGKLVGTGKGFSKKDAEKKAAEAGLQTYPRS